MPVIKGVKFGTLLVATGIAGALSAPMWNEIISPLTNPGWSDLDDQIQVTVNRDQVDSATLLLNARLASTAETGERTASVLIDLSAGVKLRAGVQETILYYAAYGRTQGVLDRCVNAEFSGEQFTTLEKISVSDAQAVGLYFSGPRNNEGWGDSESAGFYRQVITESTDDFAYPTPCDLDESFFWSIRGSRSVFAAPWMAIDVLRDFTRPPDEVLPGGGVARQEAANAPFSYCVGSSITWRSGVSPGTPSPPATHEYSPSDVWRDFRDNGYEWINCETLNDYGSDNGYSLLQTSPSLDLNDNFQADLSARTLFFAGALAGILGGLIIELVGSGFDFVEELREAKDATRGDDDESAADADAGSNDDPPGGPTSDPPDEHYSPSSGGYL